jgi:hypothetical protein
MRRVPFLEGERYIGASGRMQNHRVTVCRRSACRIPHGRVLGMIPHFIIREKHGRGKEQGRFQDGISAPGVSKEATPLGWRSEKLKTIPRTDCRRRIRAVTNARRSAHTVSQAREHDDEEARVVREIFALAAGREGRPQGVKAIACRLTDRGIARRGVRFSTGSVYR